MPDSFNKHVVITFRLLWLVHHTPNILRYSPRSLIREKMAFRFASVSEDEILKIHEEGTPLITKRRENFVFEYVMAKVFI